MKGLYPPSFLPDEDQLAPKKGADDEGHHGGYSADGAYGKRPTTRPKKKEVKD
jgi:hypothetical protein